ncbi:MAG TPA: tripartite tricarboxylate transporter TctB family protein [bacterium]|nr:tripartite tricarboxylate transporter TctB family protein [bacterium]
MRDALGAAFLAVLSVTFAVAAARIPFETSLWVWYTSPGFFPLLMALGLALFSVAIGYRGFLTWRTRRTTGESPGWRAHVRQWGAGRLIAALVMIGAFLLLLGRLPFTVASAMLITAMTLAFRDDSLLHSLRAAAAGALVIVALLLFFTRVFGIPLP